jgi:hypothetical protein
MADQDDLIALALAHLQATDRYDERLGLAVYRDDSGGWYISDDEDLADLGARLEGGETDAYSRWCSDTTAVELDLDSIAGQLDEDADLDALEHEAGCAGDRPTQLALCYLRDRVLALASAA